MFVKPDERYLSLFSSDKTHLGLIAIFDRQEREWIKPPFCHGKLHGYLSSFPNLLTAAFDRNSRGEIVASQVPKKVAQEHVLSLIDEKEPTKDEKSRKCNLNESNRHKPTTIFTDELITQAMTMKAEGMRWADVADRLSVKAASLKAVISKRSYTLNGIRTCVEAPGEANGKPDNPTHRGEGNYNKTPIKDV